MTESVEFHCVICGHTFTREFDVELRDGEEHIDIGMFGDLCPICEAQADIVEPILPHPDPPPPTSPH